MLDTVGADTLTRSYNVVKPGGFVVSIVAPPAPDQLALHKIKGAVILLKANAKELAEIASLIDEGKVKPTVSATFPLKDAAKAQDKSKSGVGRGKIVLTVP